MHIGRVNSPPELLSQPEDSPAIASIERAATLAQPVAAHRASL